MVNKHYGNTDFVHNDEVELDRERENAPISREMWEDYVEDRRRRGLPIPKSEPKFAPPGTLKYTKQYAHGGYVGGGFEMRDLLDQILGFLQTQILFDHLLSCPNLLTNS